MKNSKQCKERVWMAQSLILITKAVSEKKKGVTQGPAHPPWKGKNCLGETNPLQPCPKTWALMSYLYETK